MDTAFISKPSTWLIIALIVLLSFKFLEKPPRPEIISIPGETIVREVIQYETAPLTEESLRVLFEERFDQEFRQIQNQLNEFDMRLAALVQTQASGRGDRIIERIVTITENGECIITPIEQELALNFDNIQVPIANVEVDTVGDLQAEVYDLQLILDQVIGETDHGSITAIGRLNAMVNGQIYELPITGSTTYNLDRTILKPEQRRFRIWDPQISLNIGPVFGNEPLASLGAHVGFSPMSYGYKDLPRFRFLEIGLGSRFSHFDLYAGLAPLSWNLGEPLPMLDDLWLTPSVAYELTNQDWLLTFMIGTTF